MAQKTSFGARMCLLSIQSVVRGSKSPKSGSVFELSLTFACPVVIQLDVVYDPHTVRFLSMLDSYGLTQNVKTNTRGAHLFDIVITQSEYPASIIVEPPTLSHHSFNVDSMTLSHHSFILEPLTLSHHSFNVDSMTLSHHSFILEPLTLSHHSFNVESMTLSHHSFILEPQTL